MYLSEKMIFLLVGCLIGGLILVLIAIGILYIFIKRDKAKQKEAHDLKVRGFLMALRAEIESLWRIYFTTVGKKIEKLNIEKPFLTHYPMTQDYFTIFNLNAGLLEHLEDDDLRKSIIGTYSRAKSLVDSFKLNNDLIRQYEQWKLLSEQTKKPFNAAQAGVYLDKLTRYAAALKLIHFNMKKDVDHLLRKINKSRYIDL